jgi:hypothetical protein
MKDTKEHEMAYRNVEEVTHIIFGGGLSANNS